jgi:hypothetical protein
MTIGGRFTKSWNSSVRTRVLLIRLSLPTRAGREWGTDEGVLPSHLTWWLRHNYSTDGPQRASFILPVVALIFAAANSKPP